MARDTAQLDRDLGIAEGAIKSFRTTIASHGGTLATHGSDIATLKESYKEDRRTLSGNSTSIAGLSRTISDLSISQSKLSGTLTGVGATVTGLTLATIGISLFKVDEKGITILGATREFKWTNTWIDKWQKVFESRTQKAKRREKEQDDAILENLRRDMDKIKEALRGAARAGQATQAQRQREADRVAGLPAHRLPRGVDNASPTIKGVASDLRVLRSTVDALATAFA
ncbi:hypothetical protein [Streptomyces sp. SP18CS02]|uniref:hypothetical protein n=1 Tax=Streptomyces sp. SP18CS02 TaxID=3002531 RepID=UPI002E76167C|nr:hypothetical protein [Streptomyces sp. SP18CS02]MEE1751734.1 hypothetical protein [Streptomyces sp. SP18CS02]